MNQEIIQALQEGTQAIERFSTQTKADVKELSDRLTRFEATENRKAIFGGSAQRTEPAAHLLDVKSARRIPVYASNQQIAEHKADTPSIGRVLRGIVLGGQAPDAAQLEDERKALSIGQDPSGGYTVAGKLSSSWIDALRAEMVLLIRKNLT